MVCEVFRGHVIGISVSRKFDCSSCGSLLRLRVMGTGPPRHPRVSPTVKRWANWVLTGVWLVGGAVVLEFLHISLWAEIALVAVLLGVVLVVELVFFRWNEGRWPAVETAGNPDESNAGPSGTGD